MEMLEREPRWTKVCGRRSSGYLLAWVDH